MAYESDLVGSALKMEQTSLDGRSADAAGGVQYPAVSQLVKRFEIRMAEDRALRQHITAIDRMLNIQT